MTHAAFGLICGVPAFMQWGANNPDKFSVVPSSWDEQCPVCKRVHSAYVKTGGLSKREAHQSPACNEHQIQCLLVLD
jgi:hypothetical protein